MVINSFFKAVCSGDRTRRNARHRRDARSGPLDGRWFDQRRRRHSDHANARRCARPGQ